MSGNYNPDKSDETFRKIAEKPFYVGLWSGGVGAVSAVTGLLLKSIGIDFRSVILEIGIGGVVVGGCLYGICAIVYLVIKLWHALAALGVESESELHAFG